MKFQHNLTYIITKSSLTQFSGVDKEVLLLMPAVAKKLRPQVQSCIFRSEHDKVFFHCTQFANSSCWVECSLGLTQYTPINFVNFPLTFKLTTVPA